MRRPAAHLQPGSLREHNIHHPDPMYSDDWWEHYWTVTFSIGTLNVHGMAFPVDGEIRGNDAEDLRRKCRELGFPPGEIEAALTRDGESSHGED